jgi:hypothetical protein
VATYGHGKQRRTKTRSEETQKEKADSRGRASDSGAIRQRSTAREADRIELTFFKTTKS